MSYILHVKVFLQFPFAIFGTGIAHQLIEEMHSYKSEDVYQFCTDILKTQCEKQYDGYVNSQIQPRYTNLGREKSTLE